ncbi:MAG: hypothetical protein IJD95_05295 [Clostridia bacterium]|nr:hypothetical protein [Clostridia bacterium]
MSDNFFDELQSSSPDKVNKASEVIKEALGSDFDISQMMKNDSFKQSFNLRLSDADKQKVAALVKNPELLKVILSNPKAKQILKSFLTKR